MEEQLRSLQRFDVDASSVERTRRRCEVALARRRARAASLRWPVAPPWAEPLAVLGIGGLYLAAATRISLALLAAVR
jgi:hypothetical protein